MPKLDPLRQLISINGNTISYLDNQANLPTILCLHGRFGSGETWTGLMDHYSSRYRVIAPDQRGHGFSDKPSGQYTAEEMSADIAELISQLDCAAPIILGHSMGARVAGYLAADYPELVGSIGLLDHSAIAGRPRPTRKALHEIPLADVFTKDWPSSFVNPIQAQEYLSSIIPSKFLIDYFMNSLVNTANGWQMSFSQQAMSAIFEYQHSWTERLPKVLCPVFLVRARNSNEVSDKDWLHMQSAIANNLACEVSSPDHHVYLSNPLEFYQILDKWLAANESCTKSWVPSSAI